LSTRTPTRHARDRVGLGAHRFPRVPGEPREVQLQRTRDMLARALNLGTTVAFVGAGCSIPLGYPTWRILALELVDHTLDILAQLENAPAARLDTERLSSCKTRLESEAPLKPEALMFYLGVSKRVLSNHRLPGREDPYGEYFRRRFSLRGSTAASRHSALRNLLEIETITRYVTTNYDCEIERALSEIRHIPFEEFGIDRTDLAAPRSFTQETDYYGQLALFALGRHHEARNTVFHCHGRFDRPGSLIATESEYQEWYLTQKDGAGPAFRQTIDLLLGSNPILFVGFGLADEDLLRPLRILGALDMDHKDLRPIFALLPEEKEGTDWEQHEALFDRYGVNVVPYTSASPDQRSEDLCRALDEMKQYWRNWRTGWLEKPFLRKVQVQRHPPQPYRHYSLDMRAFKDMGAAHLKSNLDRFTQLIATHRVLTLGGKGGAGKSWHAMRFLERLQQRPGKFKGFFFWSSYYADDLLTGLDRALKYLEPEGQHEGTRAERFRRCIRRDRYCLVFDGCERLLRETDTPDEGKPDSVGVQRWLEVMRDPESRSIILLTSRLWPFPEGTEGVARFKVPRMRMDDLKRSETFDQLDPLDVSALCSLLGGHVYALSLARHVLRRAPRGKQGEEAKTLLRRLSDVHPNARVSRMIGLCVGSMDRTPNLLALKFLQRLAVFMSPVGEPTVRICYELACQDDYGGQQSPGPPTLNALLADLVEVRLVFRIATSQSEDRTRVYSVHPAVRSFIFTQIHKVDTDLLPNFTLPGFTSGTAAVYPGSERSAKLVLEIFDRLYEAGENAFQAGESQQARDLCRSALGVARSRMEANTAARWTSYEKYIRVGIQLVNLAKVVSPQVWSFVERHDLESIEADDGPLYADELAWLYNDIGLTLCAEGTLPDAYAVWEQGYEINKVIDSEEDGGQYDVQSQLHFAHIFLELGRLAEADEYLEETKRRNHALGDADYHARVLGYSALVAYMRDQLEESDRLYEAALSAWTDRRRNARAQSMFLYMRGELNSFMGKFEQAKDYIQSSRSIAEAGHCPDLIAYANNSQGNLYRLQGMPTEATHAYRAALRDARRIGIRKLEADILAELAQLSLFIGDTESARQRAMDSLRIANELALGLKQTNALYALGLATLESGPRGLGVEYLKHTKTLADRQNYWLRARQVEKKLYALGEAGPLGSQP